MPKEQTLRKTAVYEGVGLHSGKQVHMKLLPADVGTGIVFRRTDLEGAPVIHAVAENVTSTMRATTVEENGAKVFTIEHMMSAFHGLGVDNAIVELDAEEPPVADGSALAFAELIKDAGLMVQDKEREEIIIDKVYRIDANDGRFVMALPYDGFRVSFTSLNPHPLIGVQYEDFAITPDIYEREIAGARTIAFEGEIKALREMGLGLGGTLENVIVYNDEGWLNPLKYPDELVRHKILDVIGDLRLAGIMRGHIVAAASGHALNTALAKKIAENFR